MATRCLNQRLGIPPLDNVDPWPDNNWVFQLFRGLTNDDLTEIILTEIIAICERQDINEAARMVYLILILCDAMAARAATARGLIAPDI
jgi:hypothetical protein